ncbi:MAG TPA: hypothetical protein VF190_12565 [Rhodothermales bacterium]
MIFRSLYFRSRYGAYVRSEHGVKKFAEMCMGQLTRRVTKKSAFYREMNENMLVEKANLRRRQDELQEQPTLDAGEFFSVRRRLWANGLLVTAVLLAGVFLNYVAVSAFIPIEAAVSGFLRWFVSGVLAVVLMGGGLIVTERLLESLIPRRTLRSEGLYEAMQSVAPLWGILLIAIELAILGISEVRASMLAETTGSGVIYYGFIALSMMLPLVAGAIRWDAMQFIDVYQTTLALRQIESRLAQIDSILRQNEEYESNFYKIKSISYWDLLNEFKTYKDLYNQRRGFVEDLTNHFSQTYDSYQAEANKRYQADIRDVTSRSLRKLELVERNTVAGNKIGQTALRPARPTAPRPASTAGDGYLEPQPIR